MNQSIQSALKKIYGQQQYDNMKRPLTSRLYKAKAKEIDM
jgi:hypothetical protein